MSKVNASREVMVKEIQTLKEELGQWKYRTLLMQVACLRALAGEEVTFPTQVLNGYMKMLEKHSYDSLVFECDQQVMQDRDLQTRLHKDFPLGDEEPR